MDEDQGAPAPQRVEFRSRPLTRRRRRALAVVLVVAVLGLVTGSALSDPWSVLDLLPSVAVAVYAVYWSTRPDQPFSALTLDVDGLHDGSAARLHSWSGVQAVWVGRRWPLGGLELRLYSEAQSSFDRRAGVRLHPRVTTPVPGRASAAEVAAAVRRFSPAPVVTGGRRELRQLEEQLAVTWA